MDKSMFTNTDRNLFSIEFDIVGDNWLQPPNHLFEDTFKIDVKEDEKTYTVEAEVPGVDKSDIHIELEAGNLVIEVAENRKENENVYIHRERRMRPMSRTIFLSDACEEDIRAKIEGGLLEIILPKRG